MIGHETALSRVLWAAVLIFVAPQIWARVIREAWREHAPYQSPTERFRAESVR